MAPALLETVRSDFTKPDIFTYDSPDPEIFPDGIKTSGQTPPDLDKIKPYEDFPRTINGPTAWEATELAKYHEQWTHRFTEEEVEELSKTADAFMASATPLTGICKVCLESRPLWTSH